MTRTAWFRASVLLLVLAMAFPPMLAADGGEGQRGPGLAAAFWEALLQFVPVLGGEDAIASPERPADGSNPDLGPGLDPAG
jgi:hypothetical protein